VSASLLTERGLVAEDVRLQQLADAAAPPSSPRSPSPMCCPRRERDDGRRSRRVAREEGALRPGQPRAVQDLIQTTRSTAGLPSGEAR